MDRYAFYKLLSQQYAELLENLLSLSEPWQQKVKKKPFVPASVKIERERRRVRLMVVERGYNLHTATTAIRCGGLAAKSFSKEEIIQIRKYFPEARQTRKIYCDE